MLWALRAGAPEPINIERRIASQKSDSARMNFIKRIPPVSHSLGSGAGTENYGDFTLCSGALLETTPCPSRST